MSRDPIRAERVRASRRISPVAIGPGTRVGPYEVTALLGEGGMGKVWRARHHALHRDDALKVLPEIFASDPDRLARFEREAQVLASFNHPNIAHVYGLEQSDGVRALVMELIEGPTLADRLLHGAIPIAEAMAIARQIADALATAHDKGVIHRDLKPANVKVRPDGMVKVLDFGLAKALDSASGPAPLVSQSPTITSPAMTGQGVILGTAAYMSPEQASGADVDQRSDIWAFGCVLYEMLSGKPVFSGDSVARVLAKVLERDPDLAALPASTPSRIRRLIRRCLEKDPRQRVHHIADARFELEDAAADDASATAPVAASPSRKASVVPWAIAALLVGAAGASAIWALVNRSRGAAPVIRTIVGTLAPGDANPQAFRGLAISPDGQRVVYSIGGTLYLRSLSDVDSQALRGAEDASQPAFSPDGQSLAFFVPSESVIKRLRLGGGRASIIANTDGGVPRGLSWGVDDTIVFATATSGGLWRVRAEGGEPERLTTVDAKEALAHGSPSMLPNGRAVLFTAFRGATSRVGVVSLDSGHVSYPVAVGTSPRFVPTGHLVYLEGDAIRAVGFDPSRLVLTAKASVALTDAVRIQGGMNNFDVSTTTGSLVYMPAAETQKTLVWVGRDGREEPLDLPARSYGMPRVSPDGSRIVVDIRDRARPPEIWVSDLKRPGLTRIATPQQDGGDWFPKWTPDGSRVVFAIYFPDTRAPGLFWASADGTGAPELLLTIEDSAFIDARHWSRDGRSLLFTYGNPAAPRVGVLSMPAATDAKPLWKPLIERSGGTLAGPFSPDGAWLVTEASDAGDVPSIYIERYPELRDRQRVSTEGGGRTSAWSPDGRELYYRRLSDQAMMAVSIQTQPALSIGNPRVLFENRRYTAGGDSRPWDVAPDGRFLMPKESSSESTIGSQPIILVQNWFEELRRAVPAN
jgi:serine/threonine protein kinase/Tol biopolymer transport system component